MATHGMDATFDFKAAGYAAPADWARLYDLLPEPGEVGEIFTRNLDNWRTAGSTKAGLLHLLASKGIDPGPYDPETVGRRNARCQSAQRSTTS